MAGVEIPMEGDRLGDSQDGEELTFRSGDRVGVWGEWTQDRTVGGIKGLANTAGCGTRVDKKRSGNMVEGYFGENTREQLPQ